ncbi:type II toxin-antitoxin system RelE family toxin [Lentzea californiensis]|uniref:type II toxin-antitoxin system RelE family toxin n=1 Tax=Lentzea californiensis TaxID=438851 RepID=UPI002164DDCF|nr:hypothetical protein [Lentzea californiensis]
MTKLTNDGSRSPYEVRMSLQAEKSLQELRPRHLAETAMSFIYNELRFDPTEFGEYGRKLSGKLKGNHSARRRKFRVIYRIGKDVIEILEFQPTPYPGVN